MRNVMTMKAMVVLVLLFLLFINIPGGFTQEHKMNQTVYDEKSKGNIMIGYCTLDGISDTAFLSAYRREYENYKCDKALLNQMYSLLKGISVTIVMGTWCGDTKEQVPRFMRLFDDLEHSFPTPQFICVDREKKAGDVSIESLGIIKVPTFIIYYEGKELGRIIETPKTTLDQDFLDILKK